MTRIIGLTGGIASGKTTVANYLANKGAYLIDTDLIAREVVAPNATTTLAIRDFLGEHFLLPDGNLDRPKVKAHIFNDQAILTQYEAIILPAIRSSTLNALNNVPENVCYAILIVPLLFEKGLDSHCAHTISVDVSVEKQVERAIARKPSDAAIIHQLIDKQMPRNTRNARADFIVDNTVPLGELYVALDKLHLQLLSFR